MKQHLFKHDLCVLRNVLQATCKEEKKKVPKLHQ